MRTIFRSIVCGARLGVYHRYTPWSLRSPAPGLPPRGSSALVRHRCLQQQGLGCFDSSILLSANLREVHSPTSSLCAHPEEDAVILYSGLSRWRAFFLSFLAFWLNDCIDRAWWRLIVILRHCGPFPAVSESQSTFNCEVQMFRRWRTVWTTFQLRMINVKWTHNAMWKYYIPGNARIVMGRVRVNEWSRAPVTQPPCTITTRWWEQRQTFRLRKEAISSAAISVTCLIWTTRANSWTTCALRPTGTGSASENAAETKRVYLWLRISPLTLRAQVHSNTSWWFLWHRQNLPFHVWHVPFRALSVRRYGFLCPFYRHLHARYDVPHSHFSLASFLSRNATLYPTLLF